MVTLAASPEAYDLFHQGTQALAQMEANGFRVDADRLDRTIADTEARIRELEAELKEDDVYAVWRKEYGGGTKLSSNPQLAHVLYDRLGIPCKAWTSGGASGKKKPSVSEEALQDVDHPFVRKLFDARHLQKTVGTFLKGIRREVVDGYLHAFFHLNKVVTYRSSCIAKGTLIEVVRDVSKSPKGVPIEKVRTGDYVYCYDDQRRLTVRKVLWAGKTGRREVIRLHWVARGKHGHLDLTPEHRIRLIDGSYVPAEELVGDFRSPGDSCRLPKIRTLAMGRDGDRVWQTGTDEVLDHRLVYESLVGPLGVDEVVHHKDGNHYNNLPSNLQKMTKSQHAKHHVPDSLTDQAREKGWRKLRRMRARGEIAYLSGEDHPGWIKMTKYGFLRLLSESGGEISKTVHDFSVMKRKAVHLGVDPRIVRERYDRHGEYISRGRLKRVLEEGGRTLAKNEFGLNFYKLKRMMAQRGFPITRRWANQCGPFVPRNHRIVKVERIRKVVDVYDLHVEEFHNFIANEICVHNSSCPNLHNMPKHDEELARLVRGCMVARSRRRRVWELDFKGAEVCVASLVTGDPALRAYVRDKTKDMHRDSAEGLYLLERDQVSKPIRAAAKSWFVFAEFYGDYYIHCAKNLWEAVDRDKLTLADGTPLRKHLRRKGIKELGDLDPSRPPRPRTYEAVVKAFEDDFWNRRFRVYTEWKKRWWADYQANGGFVTPTGFLVRMGKGGPLTRNEALNSPIQGPSFHCLLYTLVRLQKWLNRNKMKTLLVNQVHDSIVGDSPSDEIDAVLDEAVRIIREDLPKRWDWLTIPMEVEVSVSPEGGSWHDVAEWKRGKKGAWGPEVKAA